MAAGEKAAKMKIERFRAALLHDAPPAGWSRAFQALRHQGEGDWGRAHPLAQGQGDVDGACTRTCTAPSAKRQLLVPPCRPSISGILDNQFAARRGGTESAAHRAAPVDPQGRD